MTHFIEANFVIYMIKFALYTAALAHTRRSGAFHFHPAAVLVPRRERQVVCLLAVVNRRTQHHHMRVVVIPRVPRRLQHLERREGRKLPPRSSIRYVTSVRCEVDKGKMCSLTKNSSSPSTLVRWTRLTCLQRNLNWSSAQPHIRMRARAYATER